MHKIQILVIGRNEQIVATVERLINNNPEWQATTCLTDEDAVTICAGQKFDLVLIGGGLDEASDTYLRQAIDERQPGITIIQHYGGGSGLLATEINMALAIHKS
jgi:DNA-binding NtrC family response regulator